MSVLSISALAALAASAVATACVAYVMISFRRSGHLLASRVGRRPRILVLTPVRHLRRGRHAAPARLQLRPVRVR